MNESREIKSLTSGCKIQTLNPKGVQQYEGIITALLVFAGNHFPKCNIPESDDAFWGRWDIIRCRNQFKVDEKLAEKTFTPQNMSGFLNKVIEKLFDINDNGIRRVSTYEEVYKEWQCSTSSVYKFIQDTTESTNTPHQYVKKGLYQQYLNWCETHQIPDEDRESTDIKFGKEIFKVCKVKSSKSGDFTTYEMFRSPKPQNNQTTNDIMKSVPSETISIADDWGQSLN